MKKNRILILNENENNLNQFANSCIISLSKTDYDDLKLLQQYLPDLSKKEFNEEEKEIIHKYNIFIDKLKEKVKPNNSIFIDFALKKIKL